MQDCSEPEPNSAPPAKGRGQIKQRVNQGLGPSNFWPLDPDIVFLNHGSFGSCPLPVLEFQQSVRRQLERQPVEFFVRDLEPLLDRARAALAGFIGAGHDDLVFVPNATTGVNAVLRSLPFQSGDELLVTNHEYNACRNALDFVADRTGARVVVAEIPFPLLDSGHMLDPLMARLTARTRLALIDHVTSQTALIFPVERIVTELSARGVDCLIDGAHAPGMLPLDVESIGAAYYAGNCHKWICAPKGAGFLHVRPDRQHLIRPTVISHGANSKRTDRSRFQVEFGWPGTADPSAYLSVPEALRVVGGLVPGGWPELMARNHALALAGRALLCQAMGLDLPCPDSMIGSIAAVPLPDAPPSLAPPSPLYSDPLQDQLRIEFGIEAPMIPWPSPPKRVLRISAQCYNSEAQFEYLVTSLQTLRFGRSETPMPAA